MCPCTQTDFNIAHLQHYSSTAWLNMSFFGLETVVSGKENNHEQGELDFEETYDDRLGDQLDDDNDDFNDETFGGDISNGELGRDFDFAGQTAKVAGTIDEEQVTFVRKKPSQTTASTPAARQAAIDVPSLQPIASLWGSANQADRLASQPTEPKVLSLEEVEA